MLSAVHVLIVLLAGCVGFGIFGVLGSRGLMSLEQYLVSRNTTSWWLGAATLMASGLGAWVLFSPAQTAADFGLVGLLGYAVGCCIPTLALAVLGPRMRAIMPGGYSITQFVRKRFGTPMFVMTAVVMLFYLMTYLCAELTAIAKTVQFLSVPADGADATGWFAEGIPLLLTAAIVAAGVLSYTVYGGLWASILTDGLQLAITAPVAIVLSVIVLMHADTAVAWERLSTQGSPLVEMTHRGGISFGLMLLIAVTVANLFHQGYWQRVFAIRTNRELTLACIVGGIGCGVLVLLIGLFGLTAAGQGWIGDEAGIKSELAFFAVVHHILPTWALIGIVLLALCMVMSALDTVISGIVSAICIEVAHASPSMSKERLLFIGRLLMVLLTALTVFVASFGLDVLYLFLLADLVCAAAAFPVFFGMYSRRFSGQAACLATGLGLVAGGVLFCKPDFSPLVNVQIGGVQLGGDLLASFSAALLVSSAVSVLAWVVATNRHDASKQFDFAQLLPMDQVSS